MQASRGITSYIHIFSLTIFPPSSCPLECRVLSIKAGRVVFRTLKIVFKVQLTALYPRSFPQSLL